MKKIAVIQTAFPGDVLLATPVFEALKDIYSDSHIAAVIRPESYLLLKDNPFINEIIVYDKYGLNKGPLGVMRISGLLKGYDWAVIVQRFLRSALIAYMAGIKKRTGFDISSSKLLYTDKVRYNESKHEVLRCLDLVEAGDSSEYRPKVFISNETRSKTDALLSEYDIAGDFAVMAPGSVWATKRYPRFDKLVDIVKEELGLDSVLLGGLDDIELSASIAQTVSNRPHNLTGRTDFLVSAEIMSRSKIVITNDSAPAHLAAAVGAPVVAVFGPTISAFGFAPYSENSRVVDIGELYCRPCTRHGSNKCPQRHFKCMLEFPPGKILDAIKSLIA